MLGPATSPIIYDQPPGFSLEIFGMLLLLLIAATLVFWLLLRRCTSHRQWVTLRQWAHEHGFKMRPGESIEMPPAIAALSPQVRLNLANAKSSISQIDAGARQWNLLILQTASQWTPAGLRPMVQDQSLLDLLPLSAYPAFSAGDRFHVTSTESAAARKLSRSVARALMPPDVGLLLWDHWLVLDFTSRPFDPLEFGRMIALAKQVSTLV